MKKHYPPNIHSTALVHDDANIHSTAVVGPYCIIGPKVVLNKDVVVKAHAMVEGKTQVGEGTVIYSFATVGSRPQDLKYKGEETELIIGERNQIREYANISIGTDGGGGITRIGSDNLFMVYSHVAHDCIIGNYCIFANAVALAGHVTVEDGAVIGGLAAVHQFTRIGQKSMTAGGAIVVQDIPPYCMVQGDRARPNGLNLIGMKRSGMSSEKISAVKEMYRLLYRENLTLEESCNAIRETVPDILERKIFLDFLMKSERGICR